MSTTERARWSRSRRRWWRLLIVGATALALSAIMGSFVAPRVLRQVTEQQLGRRLGRKVSIQRLRVNPFALSLSIDGLEVLEADGRTPFLSFRRLYANVELASLFRHAVVAREIRFESPRIRIERRQAPTGAWTGAAVYNFSDIVTRLAASSNQPINDVALPRFSLNNIRVTDGTLVFDDLPSRDHHEITGFTLAVPFLSTLPVDVDRFVAPGMSGRLDGRSFAIAGLSKLFNDTLESVLQVRLNALDLTRYLPYVPLPLPVAVSSASLTVAVDVSFVRPRAGVAPRLSLKGKVELADVSLRDPDREARPLLDLRDLTVVVEDADLLGRHFVIEQVLVSGAEVHARRLRDGTLDLLHLLPSVAPGPAVTREAPGAVEPRWSVKQLRIEQSTLVLRDETTQPPFEARADGISVSVAHLSNAPGAQATIEAAFVVSPGGKFVGNGRLCLDPLASTGTVSIDGLEPGRFSRYYGHLVAFRVAKGVLSLGTGYEVSARREHVALHLSEGFVTARDLTLRRLGARNDFLRLPQLAVRGVDVDVDRRTVSTAAVSSRAGRLAITRDQRGIVDLTTLVGSSPSSSAERASAPPWVVSVGRLDLEEWTIRLEDRAVSPPAVLAAAPLSLHAISLSTAPDSPGSVDLHFGLDKTGRLALAGPISIDPPAAHLRVDLRSVDIVPVQSYWRDPLTPIATSGRVSFKGRLRVEGAPQASGQPPGHPPDLRVHLNGDAELANFATIDAAKRQELFRSRSFRLDGLELATPPFSLAARRVALADFSAQLIVFPDGHFNFERAFGSSKKATLPPPAAPKIFVGQVKLDGGQVRFVDRQLRPYASVVLAELTGGVAGLSTSAGTHAEVDLRGRLEHAASLTITGQANPLAKDLFVDLKSAVKDFDLTAASAYAVKYLGYGIRAGKLSLDLAYHVGQRRLDADNHVVVAGLRFGDKVRSPGASNLPVKLAAALLVDRHGIIDVSLPVSGALDDPGFSFWSPIGKAVRNRVLEAATLAPFSMLAKAFGSREELSRVEFLPGLARLDDRAKGKLEILAKALEERRELSFEIQGGSDPAHDREGLRRDRFEQKLQAEKGRELAGQRAPGSAAGGVRLDPVERSRLLAAAYRAETFAKPRNVLGIAKSLPPAEMEQLMMANIKVGDEDLRALAVRRASVVREVLAKLAPAAAGRLLVVSPFLSGGTSVELKLRRE